MMRLSAPGYERLGYARQFELYFGGGEANVAVSLANFGVPAEFVTRLPDNVLAQAALRELHAWNVATDHVVTGGSRMGIYFTETGAVARPSNVLYDREHSAIAEIKPGMIDWDEVFAGAGWFHWTGITPAISAGAAEVCLEAVRAARKHGLTVSCDLNYRKKLWKYGKPAGAVMPALVEECDLILGNEEDAEKVFGIKPDERGYLSVCEQLMARFPRAKKIAVTLRGSINANHNTWRGVLYDGKKLYESRTYDITHIVDRIGGGDSFMGGLIYGLQRWPDDCQSAVEFAAAASCLKHTVHGDFNQVSVAEVENLMGGNASGRVNR